MGGAKVVTAVLLLQVRLGETAVAHFSAAARLVEPTQILPASLMAAVFPAISLAIVPAFVNYSLTHYLIARQQQLYLGLFTVVMLGLHLIMSWLFIDQFGVIGPAISTLISEGFLLVACLLVLGRSRNEDKINQ